MSITDTTVLKMLRYSGFVECPECRSWLVATKGAHAFHMGKCEPKAVQK